MTQGNGREDLPVVGIEIPRPDFRSAAADADLTVSAARNFAAIFRICRLAGAGRTRSLDQANKDTLRRFNVDLVGRANVSDLLLPAVEPLAERQTNVGLFAHQLLEGQIVRDLRPALAVDVIAIYHEWCARLSCREFPTPAVLNSLRVDFGVRADRLRYLHAGAIKGPHSVLDLAGNAVAPSGAGRAEWLGNQIALFRESVAAYIGVA